VAPVTWAVGLYALAVSLATLWVRPPTFQPLLPWCLFLLVFLVVDLLHGFGDRLRLPPPGEHEPAPAKPQGPSA
jgi:hypothetical protein